MKKYLGKLFAFLLVLFIGITLTACNSKDSYNTNVPYGTLGNNAYASADGYTLTEKGLYDEMRSNGYDYLINEIKLALFKPETYNLNTTDNLDELKEIINSQCYGQTEIDDLAESTKKTSVKKYVDTMSLLGVTVEEDNIYTEDCLSYYLPTLAQKYFAKALITDSAKKYYFENEYEKENGEFVLVDNEKVKNPYYIDEDKIKSTYNSSFKNDVNYQVIVLGFNTLAEAEALLETQGTITSTNALAAYTAMYQSIYPYKDSADFTVTDDDLNGYNASLKTLIKNLKEGEYTVLPQQFGSMVYLVYKVADKDIVEYADITTEKKQEVVEKIIDDFVTASYISQEVNKAMYASNITIYDPLFDALYANANSDYKRLAKKDWNDSYNANVAKVNDTVITVADFYQALEKQIGITCTMDYFTNKLLLNSEYASKLTADDEKKIQTSYKNALKDFKDGKFESYGYPASIGEDNFKFLYYGTSKEDEILNYYRAQKIWDYAIADYPADYFTILENFGKQYAENYFNLSVKHVLLTVDYDMDGTPDDPDKFREKLPDAERTDFDQALVTLMDAIVKEANYLVENDKASLVDALSFIQTQYYANGNILSQAGKTWNDLKKYNIGVTVEDLKSVNNTNASNYVKEFGEGVKALYKQLHEAGTLEEDYIASEVTSLDQLIKTTYGYHILGVYESAEMTSAKYTADDDTSNQYNKVKITWKDEEKTIDAYSDNEYASVNQLMIYAAQTGTTSGITDLPTAVKTFIAYFYNDFTTRYSNDTFQNILLAEKYLSNMNFADTANKAKFDEFVEIQKRQYDSYEDYSKTSNQVFAGWWEAFLTTNAE